ncbi:MAG: thioredoxin-dependent thiol peroxidase [Candidatus Zixiibacteriota bacterium]|jgi:peroxiredoxin Q/BCP
MAGSSIPDVGSKAPAFTLENQDGKKVSLKDFEGQWVVLYFYPKDNTPGCTTEACEFTDAMPNFKKLKAVVLGVSPDSVKSHQNFIAKQNLGITLLSDPDHRILEKYGVWQLKKNYGKEYHGVVRTTFLINPNGRIEHIWEKVKARGHAEAVQEFLTEAAKKK